jgi:four helix bundle protein
VVRFSRNLAQDPSCRHVAHQLLNAATSVGANSEEAKSAYSRREFALKNSIALKEARESVFWLRLILSCDLSADPETTRLLKEAVELVGILSVTVRSARRPTIP